MQAEAFLPSRVELELEGNTAAQVFEYLRRIVYRGELGPGDRLPAERELAVMLHVSRDTLREALQDLEAAGFLVRRRGTTGGSFITDLERPFDSWRAGMVADRTTLFELWDLREAAEVQIARLAAARRHAADLTALQSADDALREAETRADFRRFDLRFHGALATAAGSKRLATLMYIARGELFSPVDAAVVPARVRLAADGHATVIGAIRERNPDAAGELMRSHLATARQEMKKALGIR